MTQSSSSTNQPWAIIIIQSNHNQSPTIINSTLTQPLNHPVLHPPTSSPPPHVTPGHPQPSVRLRQVAPLQGIVDARRATCGQIPQHHGAISVLDPSGEQRWGRWAGWGAGWGCWMDRWSTNNDELVDDHCWWACWLMVQVNLWIIWWLTVVNLGRMDGYVDGSLMMANLYIFGDGCFMRVDELIQG